MFSRIVLCLSALLVGACTSHPPGCVTGQSIECACAPGRRGVQTCGSDQTFQACVCAGADASVDERAPALDASDAADEPSSTSDVVSPDDSPADAAAPDATISDVASSEAGPADGACNALAIDTPTVHPESAPGGTPTPMGGTIADGTYVLTRLVRFGGSTTSVTAVQKKWRITGGSLEMAYQQTSDNGGTPSTDTVRQNYTYTTDMAMARIRLMETCTSPYTQSRRYTATPDTLLVIETDTEVQTFTRMP